MSPALQVDGVTLPLMTLRGVAMLLLLLLPAAVFVGHRFGTMRRRRLLEAGRGDVTRDDGTTLSAIMALLGLLLAFSFGNALSIAQERKAAMVDEAAALGTVFQRADYLPEPGRTELQAAILDYARTRVPAEGVILDTSEKLAAFLDVSLRAQERLWPLTLRATADPVPPPIQAFVGGAMNAALDAHLVRLSLLSVPVSDVVHVMVLGSALAALVLLGNRTGLGGNALNARHFSFAAILLVVMLTILDVQRSTEGLIRVDFGPLLATIADMEQALAGRQ